MTTGTALSKRKMKYIEKRERERERERELEGEVSPTLFTLPYYVCIYVCACARACAWCLCLLARACVCVCVCVCTCACVRVRACVFVSSCIQSSFCCQGWLTQLNYLRPLEAPFVPNLPKWLILQSVQKFPWLSSKSMWPQHELLSQAPIRVPLRILSPTSPVQKCPHLMKETAKWRQPTLTKPWRRRHKVKKLERLLHNHFLF